MWEEIEEIGKCLGRNRNVWEMFGKLTSKPSSPVYPQRVMIQFLIPIESSEKWFFYRAFRLTYRAGEGIEILVKSIREVLGRNYQSLGKKN